MSESFTCPTDCGCIVTVTGNPECACDGPCCGTYGVTEFSPEAIEAAAKVWCERNGFVYYAPQWKLGRKGRNYENAEAALAAALKTELGYTEKLQERRYP